MSRTSDVKEKGITWRSIRVVLIFDLIIIGIWFVGVCYSQKMCWNILKDIPELLRNLATFSGTILAAVAAYKVVYKPDKEDDTDKALITGTDDSPKKKKGGTKFYPIEYGENILGEILKKYDNDQTLYKVVREKIDKLNVPQGDFNNKYFKIVYKLQSTNEDFVKVWNDYNFNYDKFEIKNYLNKLEHYIFYSVYYYELENPNI
ncbi:MAG: hypothetical protein ABSG94_06850 [Brevinematales bacterium]|jgi:hypothetical protein